ncbi:MAG TPA: hypothetical protein VKB84_17715 [Candidatus Binataceae bacterium]|nr:hypothetical protein [Candidatus Binataceae bacterium]
MAAIAGIPGLIALIVCLRRGPALALIDVYLPVLLLLPDYYRWVLPGLPDPTFNEAAIIPIFALFVMRGGGRWRFSITDLLIFGLALEMAYSEFINTNYSDSQNLMFDCVANIIAPYVLAKALVEPQGLRVEFARKFCALMAAVAVVSVFEFRMGSNPAQMILSRFFPGQTGWVTTFRYGFARIAGPYGHAILAGVIFAVAYRVQRWLEWNGYWEGRMKWLPIKPARFLTYAIAAGSFMTLCRGPWIGEFFGMIAILLGRAANRARADHHPGAGVRGRNPGLPGVQVLRLGRARGRKIRLAGDRRVPQGIARQIYRDRAGACRLRLGPQRMAQGARDAVDRQLLPAAIADARGHGAGPVAVHLHLDDRAAGALRMGASMVLAGRVARVLIAGRIPGRDGVDRHRVSRDAGGAGAVSDDRMGRRTSAEPERGRRAGRLRAGRGAGAAL